MSKSKKKKKQKVVYIDDGSSIIDMSGTQRASRSSREGTPLRPRAGFREQFETYKQSVKMMFVPMLVVIAAISVIFLALYLIFEFAA